jgi:hypothetical protein
MRRVEVRRSRLSDAPSYTPSTLLAVRDRIAVVGAQTGCLGGDVMRNRLPLVLSITALVVALMGATPLGRAAVNAAVPLAKRAYLADTAKNAVKVNNIKASRTPTPGMLLPLDSAGKLPASVGAVGPQGTKGDKGEQGAPGLVRAYAHINADGSLDTSRSSKGVVGSRTQSAYTCVKLDSSIDASKAVVSVTPDIADFDFSAAGSIAVPSVATSGCTGSNEVFVGIVGLGTSINGGNPYVGPAAFHILVP